MMGDAHMRSTLVTVALIMICAFGYGQSKPTGDIYAVGDTLLLSTDRLPSNRRIAAPASGNYWNFRSLQAPYTRMVLVRANKSARVSADYIIAESDGAEYFIEEENGNQWIRAMKIDQAGHDMLGVVKGDMPYRNIDIEENDTLVYTGSIVFKRSVEFESGTLEFADSLRVIADWAYRVSRDMEGKIDIESGVYDAVRYAMVKTVDLNVEARIYGKWTVLEDYHLNQIPPQLREGITYHWWTEGVAQPLAFVVADKYGSAQSVTFKASPLVGRKMIDDLPSVPDIFVHPNPTFGFVRFEMINLPPDTYTIEVYNIIGVKIRSFETEVNGRVTVPQDFSELKRGTYIYRLVNSSLKTIRSKRLVIIQP